jgi:hypothetical protein
VSKNSLVSKKALETAIQQLEKITIAERMIHYQLRPNRAVIIVHAAKYLIL